MRGLASLLAFALLSGCWYEHAQPVRPSAPAPPAEAESSYRAATIAVDALGVAAMAVGLIGLRRGYNEDVSGGFLVAGLTAAAYVSPILHLAHGHKARAGGSFLVRSIAASTGTVAGIAAGCGDDRRELFCGLTSMMWGVTGGLAIAGVLDAVYFHDDRSTERWVPTVSVGGGDARVGILGSF